MVRAGVRNTYAALLIGAAVVLAFPGAAAARTTKNPCSVGAGLDPSGLVCTAILTFTGGDEAEFGPDPDAYGNVKDLPASEILQCPSGQRIPGTDYWSTAFSYNWDWDYFVGAANENSFDWGEWILWDGLEPDVWPQDGVLPGGQPGYYAFTVGLTDWHYGVDETRDTRLFWNCASAGTSKAASTEKTGVSGNPGADTLRGGATNDALVGRRGNDRLLGGAGEDHLQAGGGSDHLDGGPHDDLMHARGGADEAIGGSGDDNILTGRGDDVARGGSGDDQLFDNEGEDRLHGGPGDDHFSAHDGRRDLIRCGPGEDVAIIDRVDGASGCEQVFRRLLQ